MKKYEGFGIDYERYALIKLQNKLVRQYGIKSVLEIPAGGTKAIPSLYSLGFGLAGADVTLANGSKEALKYWDDLGVKDKVSLVKVDKLTKTSFKDNSFDLVWNYAFIPEAKDPQSLINEMARISKRYIATFSVNNLNPGFTIHKTVHKITKIPWTHGDRKLNSVFHLKKLFKQADLKIKEIGVVDCPPWPDSLGFRDVRIHRMGGKLDKSSFPQIVDYLDKGNLPFWMKLVYKIETLPLPLFLKTFYAHVFYLIGEK